MARKFPIHPVHPERVCWGCDRYCPADGMACGNGPERAQHPVELFGEDWMDWQQETAPAPSAAADPIPYEPPDRTHPVPSAILPIQRRFASACGRSTNSAKSETRRQPGFDLANRVFS